MQALFSETGARRLDDIARPGLLCAFDFDGTLAPIVPHPGEAWLSDDTRRRLVTLALYAPIAVITGRSLEDIRVRLGFEPDFLVGNHGLEGVPGWEPETARHRALCDDWKAQLATALSEHANGGAIALEDKQYSLSVHYRHAPDPGLAAQMLEEIFARMAPRPRVVAGKFVFNLMAEDGCNKGSALERLMQICDARSAVYAGDDVTDEDVFRLRRGDVLSVRIEPHADSAADFFVPQAGDILQVLDELAGRLHAWGARNWVRTKAPIG